MIDKPTKIAIAKRFYLDDNGDHCSLDTDTVESIAAVKVVVLDAGEITVNLADLPESVMRCAQVAGIRAGLDSALSGKRGSEALNALQEQAAAWGENVWSMKAGGTLGFAQMLSVMDEYYLSKDRNLAVDEPEAYENLKALLGDEDKRKELASQHVIAAIISERARKRQEARTQAAALAAQSADTSNLDDLI